MLKQVRYERSFHSLFLFLIRMEYISLVLFFLSLSALDGVMVVGGTSLTSLIEFSVAGLPPVEPRKQNNKKSNNDNHLPVGTYIPSK